MGLRVGNTTVKGIRIADTPPQVPLKDVVFIDYDGTIVATYTKSDFLNLESLPSNPTHSGLTAQGWNWTLADAKTFVQTYGFLTIGQNYKTDDDCTRLYYTCDDNTFGNNVKIGFDVISGTVTIDWGDGTATSTTSGTGNKGYDHLYAEKGNYIITLKRNNNATYKLGYSGSTLRYFLEGVGSNNSDKSWVAAYGFTKCELSDGVTGAHKSAFAGASNLKIISVPLSFVSTDGTTGLGAPVVAWILPPSFSIYNSAGFSGSVKYISFNTITFSNTSSIGTAVLLGCTGVDMFAGYVGTNTLAPGFSSTNNRYYVQAGTYTTVRGYTGRYGRFMKKVVIPASVTTINAYAFLDYRGTLYLLPTTPPTLDNTNAINMFDKICVPYSSDHSILDAYKTATNWSTYASKMEEV